MLLDDPLSAVDAQVGKHIFYNCISNGDESMLKDKTVVFVTHQLQYLKHCDDVIMMNDGRFVEVGNHDRLMSNDGNYAEMIR